MMKYFKRILRVCALILFMLLAATGIGIFGVALTLTKDRKLFADIEARAETAAKENKTGARKELNDLNKK